MTLAVAVAGIVLVVAGSSVRWVRPSLSPAVLLFVAMLVPGPGRVVAALAVLPFLAVVWPRSPRRSPSRAGRGAVAGPVPPPVGRSLPRCCCSPCPVVLPSPGR